jgi:hypothetical protein
MKCDASAKVIQIAGSCSRKIDSNLVKFSHATVKNITNDLIKLGYSIVTTVGSEERMNEEDDSSETIIYYWDVLDAVYEHMQSASLECSSRILAYVVASEKAEKQIPEYRKDMWKDLINRGVISFFNINPGWNSGACKRLQQEKLSDALITLGGGEGVEHLASLYVANGKPVLPLDMPLDSSCSDGLGGSSLLSKIAISHPERFIPRLKNASQLISLRYNNYEDSPEKYANSITEFIKNNVKPQVFYIRILNNELSEYESVEKFFRSIVDPIIAERGYCIKEMGTSETRNPFINVEIFEEIYKSSVVIADISGLRNNCFMEMGYAFGLNKKVLLTAAYGTELPFDPKAIPCYFWNIGYPEFDQRENFKEFWDKNINRPPLISRDYIF